MRNNFLAIALLAGIGVLAAAFPSRAQMSASDLVIRLEQLENQMRQLTGTVEQLQYRNQQLEQALRQLREDPDADARNNVSGPARPVLQNKPTALPGPAQPPPQSVPGRRSDVFDPSQNPNAPGAPRVLGNPAEIAPEPDRIAADEPPIGAPGGRVPGAPLDLSTLAANAARNPPPQPGNFAGPGAQLPPMQPPRGPGQVMATLPPSQSPQDEYDLNYGYILHKDYALAEQGFRSFLQRYENDESVRALIPDAQYWLGESLFQRQRYQDAADYFLAIVRDNEKAPKAPEAMLRLGQSLAALGEKETACATLNQVGVKYPRASPSVRQGVQRVIKRAHC
jgi:tol-pal system protein YbgF